MEERMTNEEMQRFLNMELRRGTKEIDAYRALMEVLGVKVSYGVKEESN